MATILVADDNSNIQKMVSLAFQEKGIRVVAVGNGEAACRKVSEVRPDVVLADVFMPVRNGYEVCEFVKQDPEFAETPVILLVGAFDPLDEKEAARVGANGVLKKPFVPPDPLISLVSSLLGRIEPAVEEAPAETSSRSADESAKIEYTTPVPTRPRPPQEFAFGSDEEDQDAAITFGEPVAAPAAKAPEQEDGSEEEGGPENEWARRRASMDYEIDPADSADMVERLAAKEVTSDAAANEESEILASNKHLPFGGANIPELLTEEPRRRWSDFLKNGPKAAEHAKELSGVKPEQTKAPAQETAAESRESSPETSMEFAQTDSRTAPTGEFELSEVESQPESAEAIPLPVPEWKPRESTAGEASSDNKVQPWVMPEERKESRSPDAETSKWLSGALSSASQAPLASSDWTGAQKESFEVNSEEPAYATSMPAYENITESSASPAAAPPQSSAEAVSAKPTDPAVIDDVVAKVISKLEPQLHEALANGVLRPLVEEILNQQREKK